MILRDILNTKGTSVLTISPDVTLAEAVRQLVEHNYGSLVVADGQQQMIGIITERDILRACVNGDGELKRLKVKDRMTADVVTGAPDDDINKTMGVMTENHIRHLPVLENGRLAGLISIGDVVKAQHNQLSVENHYLKSYIQS